MPLKPACRVDDRPTEGIGNCSRAVPRDFGRTKPALAGNPSWSRPKESFRSFKRHRSSPSKQNGLVVESGQHNVDALYANYRSLIQPVSAGTRKVVSSRTASVSGATVFKSGATCFGGGPPQARITKFARGTMSFECCFVDRTRRKNAANCLDANLSVP